MFLFSLFLLLHKRLEIFILVTVLLNLVKIENELCTIVCLNSDYTSSPSQCFLVVQSACRLENTLNYGLERVWAIGYLKGSRR